MPKLKTNRGAAKRFKVSGSGRIKRKSANRNHILTKKSTKRLRHLRTAGTLIRGDERSVKRMLAIE